MILKAILFIIWMLFVLAIMFFILRMLWRVMRTYLAHTSDDPAERILDAADQFGADTSGIRKRLESTIGEKVRDLGFIEARSYGGLKIEYSAHLSDVEGRRRIILVIKDEAFLNSMLNLSTRKDEHRIPIRSGAAKALFSILEGNEERFMRIAEDYESRIAIEQMIERDPLKKTKNTLLRWFAFLPLKNFGRIDQILEAVPRKDGRRIEYQLDINTYIGKEFDEIMLVLRFEMQYSETGRPGKLHYILYYPFGAEGRNNLRRILSGRME